MLTIEELLERNKQDAIPMNMPGYQLIVIYKGRFGDWQKLLVAINDRSKHIKFFIRELEKHEDVMAEDELELIESLKVTHNFESSKTNRKWARVSLHVDTFSQLERASAKQCVSNSDIAEIAIRTYCKSIGIE